MRGQGRGRCGIGKVGCSDELRASGGCARYKASTTLHHSAQRTAHETGGDLEDVERHGGRKKAALDVLREELENVIDLVLETTRKHLIGLIEGEDAHVVWGGRERGGR